MYSRNNTERVTMKTLLQSALIAGFIIGLHLIAAFMIEYAAWLGILLLAWLMGSLMLIVLKELANYEMPDVQRRSSRSKR